IGDVEALKDRLRAKGVEVLDAPTLMGRERFFSRDPFGNRLEFMTLPDGNAE
ncbi:MAG: VOC family protein, partial [Chloroflexi bacterium]|nr:VOC family protein [Chloroflexota bacterium]